MIKASSLIYAIIIALILAILTASILLSQYLKILETENDILESKIRVNAISAINYFLVSENYALPSDRSISLYGDTDDSVSIHIEKWGILDLLTATASAHGKTYSKTALVGDILDKKNDPALYLADNNTPLALCGKTVIKGNCILPKSGVKRAYIEGQNFIGTQLIDGKVTASNSSLPPIDKSLLDYLVSLFNYLPSASDSFVAWPTVTNYYWSFSHTKQIIYSNDRINIGTGDLEGKIIVVSKTRVEIRSQSTLKDLIIVAPMIQIDDGFSGDIQAFATDSICVGKNVNLKYPSVVSTITGSDKKKHPIINIDDGTSISGLILIDAGFDPLTKKPNLNINKGAQITGMIYCNGIVNMNGSVIGSIYCNTFILKTASAIYENNLLNSTIDISQVPDGFSMRNFLNTKPNRNVIKWL
jgi:hypothetical protein